VLHVRSVSIFAAWALILGLAAVVGAAPASACTRSSTYCAAQYYGLLLNTSGKVRAEIDTTTSVNNLNKKIFNDAYGDREWAQAPLRDRNTGDGDAVYVEYNGYTNGTYCYLNSIGVSAGPGGGGVTVGQGCTSGWHQTNSDVESKHIQDSAWWFMSWSKGVDPLASSIRITVKPCQDESWVPDECGGSRLLGISYS
jgi:hypothetical protein